MCLFGTIEYYRRGSKFNRCPVCHNPQTGGEHCQALEKFRPIKRSRIKPNRTSWKQLRYKCLWAPTKDNNLTCESLATNTFRRFFHICYTQRIMTENLAKYSGCRVWGGWREELCKSPEKIKSIICWQDFVVSPLFNVSFSKLFTLVFPASHKALSHLGCFSFYTLFRISTKLFEISFQVVLVMSTLVLVIYVCPLVVINAFVSLIIICKKPKTVSA